MVSSPSPANKLLIPDAPLPSHTFFREFNLYLPLAWSNVNYKAQISAKSDDAESVFRHWNDRVTLLFPHAQALLQPLRRLLLRISFRRLYLEFRRYLRLHYGSNWFSLLQVSRRHNREGQVGGASGSNVSSSTSGSIFSSFTIHSFLCDWSAGCHALTTYLHSDFFTWHRGSTLIFWRWDKSLIPIARDGFEPYQWGHLPRYFRRPIALPPGDQVLFFNKVKKFIVKHYITPDSEDDPITSTVDYFAVPKGDNGIRPVFNGTICGLNAVLGAPNFWLPTASSLLEDLHYNFQSVDLDMGEIFNNSPLHSSVRSASDVDLSQFKDLL